MAMVTVGAFALPNPTKYKVIIQDIDSENTGRSETAELTRERIAVKYTIQNSYRIPVTDIDDIATALSPASISVTFINPYVVGLSTTATMYVGNREAELVHLVTGSESASYWDLTFDFIQY